MLVTSGQAHGSPYCVSGHSGARKDSNDDKDHRHDAEEVRCVDFLSASDINNFITHDVTQPRRVREMTLLLHARDQLKNYPTQLMTDAELFVQCKLTKPYRRNFRFLAGKAKNKFICYMNNDGEPVFYLEQKREPWFAWRKASPPAVESESGGGNLVKKAAIDTAGAVASGVVAQSAVHGIMN